MTGPAPRRSLLARWRAETRPDDAAAIYGTIVTTAVIGAAGSKSAQTVLELAVGTLLVFWLAHVYAMALAHHLQGVRLNWSAISHAMLEERPMLEAPVPSLLVLLLGAIGLLEDRPAVVVALLVGVAQLVGWGIAYARSQDWGWPMALAAGLVNGMFGLAVVILEVLLH
ncbi:MAG TPA: hypothetical protein VHO00_05005 [Actinomycetes bacterium]|nr:hypothetical protein [Actinomycetes bacterium]